MVYIQKIPYRKFSSKEMTTRAHTIIVCEELFLENIQCTNKKTKTSSNFVLN